jgi:transposase
MNTLNRDERRLLIGTYYLQNKDITKREIAERFIALSVPKSSVYDIMRRVDKGIPLERVKGQGRKRHKMTQKLREKFVEKIDGKIGVSTTKLAKKFKISQPYVRQLIRFYHLKKWKRKSTKSDR